jgi:cold shock CspA family protein
MKSREYGVIQTYNGAFCFIRPETGERDVFAHESELPDGIRRGDRVSFDLAPDTYKPGKMCAKTVRLEDEKGPSADA